MNRKGFTSIFLLTILLIVAIAGGSIYYFFSKPATTSPEITQLPKPTMDITNQTITSSPSPAPSGSSPQAITLDVNLNIHGITLQTITPTDPTEDVTYNPINNPSTSSSYKFPEKEYQVVLQGSNNPTNPMSFISKELGNQNWNNQISVDNYDFVAPSAGGVCGDVNGYLGVKDNQLRMVTIDVSTNPCYAPDGSSNTRPGPLGTTYTIWVSDIVNINQILPTFKFKN